MEKSNNKILNKNIIKSDNKHTPIPTLPLFGINCNQMPKIIH